jgi:hypothetical protein
MQQPCGQGRGDVLLPKYAQALNGQDVGSPYLGGQGRGDVQLPKNATALDGQDANIMYAGGQGRGDVQLTKNAVSLSGQDVSPIYAGGQGRGDVQLTQNALDLNGQNLNTLYTGGLGRGDVQTTVSTLAIAGENLNAVYAGGAGRGDVQLLKTATAITGEDLSVLYTGGVGRGDAASITLSSVPLPVVLSYFKAEPQTDKVRLYWATATETNNALFTVEKSLDGQTFSPIGTVAGAGNSNTEKDYELYDPHPVEGIQYYRLRQTDKDGRFTNSAIVLVRYGGTSTKQQITVYPNPTKGLVTLKADGGAPLTGTALVLDMNGKVLKQLATNSQQVQVDFSGYAAGSYFIKLSSGEVLKVVKE